MFDLHSPEEWVRAMKNFEDYEVEFYAWGGEPFLLDGTYEVVKGWTQYDHVISGSRIDTNMAFADKIADRCPTDKLKLNCSWHTQYETLDSILSKSGKLNDLGMVGMVNFVASRSNLEMLEQKYKMTPDELIKTFGDIGIFLNIAADFGIVNGRDGAKYADYKKMILNYVNPEDWKQLRCEKESSHCDANHHFFTIHPNGDITPCLTGKVVGNFFTGQLEFPECGICTESCPSLVAYPFREDNNFSYKRHLVEYVNRNKAHREQIKTCGSYMPLIGHASRTTYLPGETQNCACETSSEKIAITTLIKEEPTAQVSIVLPTYNHIKYLPKVVESILGQTFKSFELIIVNDGSTDGTREYLDTLTDPRVRVISQENSGLPGALNIGFLATRGEMLTWTSSDNYWAPNFVETFVAALDANPDIDFAYSSFAWIDDQGNVFDTTRDQNMTLNSVLACNPGMASFMYRRSLMLQVGLYDPAVDGAEDWDMWIRMMEKSKTVYIPEVLYYYRVHKNTMTSEQPTKIRLACRKAFEKALARKNNSIDLQDIYPIIALCSDKASAEFYGCLDIGTRLLRSPFDASEEAVQFLEAAITLDPNSTIAAANLAVAYGMSSRWAEAELLALQLKQVDNPQVQRICDMVNEANRYGRSDLLKSAPLLTFNKKDVELFQLEQAQRRVYPEPIPTGSGPGSGTSSKISTNSSTELHAKQASKPTEITLDPTEGVAERLPHQVHFLMNDKCNAKCIMCGGDYARSKSGKRITITKFKKMAANLKLGEIGKVCLAGAGDPLLNPDLIPIIQFINQEYPNVDISITTNGIGLTKTKAEALLKCKFSLINISMNAGTAETYKRVMQVDCFDKVCKNIENFTTMKNKMGKKTTVRLSSAISKLNIEELPTMVELGHTLAIDAINVMYCRFYPESIRNLNIEKQEYLLKDSDSLYYHQELSDEMVEKAKRLASQYGISLTHEPPFKQNANPRPCTWPNDEIMVGFNGEVYPCGGAEVHFKNKVENNTYHFGNALSETIDEFWNGDLYRSLRVSSQQEKCSIKECNCCANIVRPNDIRSHIMDWEDVDHQPKPKAKSTDETPLVSVIVPTYNRPQQIVETIDSIIEQTYKNIEIIVVNDAGPDIESVISQFKDRCNIEYLRHTENRGLAATRNTGIQAANGKYIAYLDDDDIYYPEHIEKLVNFLETTDYKVVYTDANRAHQQLHGDNYIVTHKDVPYSSDFDRDGILTGNRFPVLCVMHEKSCIDEVGGFDEFLRAHEDWDLWIRMSREFNFGHIKEVTCQFSWRDDGTTMTSGTQAEFLRTTAVIFTKYHGYAKDKPHILEAQERCLQWRAGLARKEIQTRLQRAEQLFEYGKTAEAIDEITAVLKNYPGHPEAHNDLGVIYFQSGDLQQATYHFEQALTSDPEYQSAWKNLGDIMTSLGTLEQAIQAYQKALEIDPNDTEVLLALADISFQLGDKSAATEFLTQVTTIEPGNETAHKCLTMLDGTTSETSNKQVADSRRPFVSVVIPVHNQVEYTVQCLQGIYETGSKLPFEVIVVDNASTDSTPAKLAEFQSKYPNLRVITNTSNENYSHANNQGVAEAKGTYIVFLNNDTKPFPGWIEAIVNEFDANQTIGIQGAKLLYENDTIQHAGMVFGARPGRMEEPYHAYICAASTAPFVNKKRFVQFVTGACLAVRRDLFNAVGGFDEKYVFGWEDTDLCMKAKSAGFKVLYNPDVMLYHFESVTKKLREQNGESLTSSEAPHERKNMERFFAKWGDNVVSDADEFYAEDGFRIDGSKLIPMEPIPAETGYLTSLSQAFWDRNYKSATNVLVKCTSAIGDTLYLTSVVAEMKCQFPHLHIAVSGRETVESIFRHHPAVEEFVTTGSARESDLAANADVIVDYNGVIGKLPEYFNGISLQDIFANIAGVSIKHRSAVYTVEPNEAEWATNATKTFSGLGLTIGVQFTTGKDPKRSYPHGTEVIKNILDTYPDAQIVVFGQDSINCNDSHVYDCAAKGVTLRNQLALAFKCDAFITVDSAFLHVGQSLCHKPTLAIFGPTNPVLCGNQDAGFAVVRNKSIDCHSCYWQKECNTECMTGLKPETVVEAFGPIAECITAKKVTSVKSNLSQLPIEPIPANHERIECPLCGSTTATPYRSASDIVKCASCDTVYLRTRFTKDAMVQVYQMYADQGSHMALPATNEEINKSDLRRDYFLKEILEFVPTRGNHLDIGCGWGAFLDNTRSEGFTPRGIEITRKCVEFANKRLGIPVTNDQFLDTTFATNTTSLVTALHVLEHLPEPKEALEQIYNILEPGGIFCGIVPNIESMCSQALGNNWEWIDPYHHYVHYSPKTIKAHLENAGFVVERIYTTEGDYRRDIIKAVAEKVLKTKSEAETTRAIEQVNAAGHGEEIRFFARKPIQAVPQVHTPMQDEFRTVTFTVSKTEDCAIALVKFLRSQKWTSTIVLDDPYKVAPAYAKNWNGLTIDSAVREAFATTITATKATSNTPAKPMKVAWEGSQFVHHSLALVNRELCIKLIDAGYDLSIIPYEIDQFGAEADPRFAEITNRITTRANGSVDVHVRHQWPPKFEKPATGKWVMIQPWEFGSLPKKWVQVMSTEVDEVWVPTSWVRDCYIKSGIPTNKVQVVPNGVDPGVFNPKVTPTNLTEVFNDAPAQDTFKFLFVGGSIWRKGIDVLLSAYLKAFSKDDNVCLVIKDMGGQSFYKGQTFQETIENVQAQTNAPKIAYTNTNLSPNEIPGLYTACDCLVHPYRGEGFGLPIAEAMACGLPVVVTGYGAALDFCNSETAYLITATEARLSEKRVGDMETVDYPWVAEPDVDALAQLMRHVYEHKDEAQSKGKKASEHILTNFTWEQAAAVAETRLKALTRSACTSATASQSTCSPETAAKIAEIETLLNENKVIEAADLAYTSFNGDSNTIEALETLRKVRMSLRNHRPAINKKSQKQKKTTRPSQAEIDARLSKINSILNNQASVQTTTAKPKLSLCMIVKNEEKFIEDCLKSVQGIADEMVVVDTGSTDQTIEIAKSFGASIYNYNWTNSFANARNEAISHANGEWVLVLDADERLDATSKETVLKAIKSTSVDAYEVTFKNYSKDDSTTEVYTHRACRLYRNRPSYRYQGRVHERIIPAIQASGGKIAKLDVTIHHYGYQPQILKNRNKHERYIKLLREDLSENPNDIQCLYNLGVAYSSSGDYQMAIVSLEKAAGLIKKVDEFFAAGVFFTLAQAFCAIGKPDEALSTINRAKNMGIKHPELDFYKGNALMLLKRCEEAIKEYKIAIQTGQNGTWIGDAGSAGFKAEFGIASANTKLGKFKAAESYAAKLVSKMPNDPQIQELCGRIAYEINNMSQAETHFRKAIELKPGYPQAHNGLGQVQAANGQLGDSLQSFVKAIGIDPGYAQAYINAADLLLYMGNYQEAANTYQTVLSIEPNNAEGFLGLGNCYTQMGIFDAAQLAFKQALTIQPEMAEAVEAINTLNGVTRQAA